MYWNILRENYQRFHVWIVAPSKVAWTIKNTLCISVCNNSDITIMTTTKKKSCFLILCYMKYMFIVNIENKVGFRMCRYTFPHIPKTWILLICYLSVRYIKPLKLFLEIAFLFLSFYHRLRNDSKIDALWQRLVVLFSVTPWSALNFPVSTH